MPSTPSEAVAHAHLFLNFPPAADKMEEWRATFIASSASPTTTNHSRRCFHSSSPPRWCTLPVRGLEAMQPWCNPLHDNNTSGRANGSSAMITCPWHCPICVLTAINAKLFKNNAKKTHVPQSSGDRKHTVNLIDAEGPLSMSMR